MTDRVDVLAYDGCFATEVFGILDLLTVANRVSAALRPGLPPPFAARVVSVRGPRVEVSGGVQVQAAPASADADRLIVPGCGYGGPDELGPWLAACAPEVAFLRTLDETPTPVASVCLGAFLLAEAGLLAGRRATTGWLFAPELARRHPGVDVQATAMVVQDGRVATAGAFSAVLDLALQLVADRAGASVARTTAKLTAVAVAGRSQGPYIDESLFPVTHTSFSDDVREWLRHNLSDRYDLSRLAQAHHVSTRTLLRRYAAETGEAPLAYLRRVRVSTAKRLLETSDLTVHEVMARVGYTDAPTFRRLFVEQAGVTPSDYRRQAR